MRNEKPIIFSTEMVQAILAGRKTQTRRVIKEAKSHWVYDHLSDDMQIVAIDRDGFEYGKPVDGLYATFEGSDGDTEFPVENQNTVSAIFCGYVKRGAEAGLVVSGAVSIRQMVQTHTTQKNGNRLSICPVLPLVFFCG